MNDPLSPSLLHVFDMDGTLLRDTTASLQIAQRLGRLSELASLEASFVGGALTTHDFALALCRLWHDLTPAIVSEAFAASPWIDGLPEVCADIRARGERSIVITMSPDFFASGLRASGVDDVFASNFPALPFPTDLSLDLQGILTPAAKVTIVDRVRAMHGLERDQCVAYGDSLSDALLFSELKYTVAVNADDGLRSRALLSYQGNDLRDAYRMARARIDGDRAHAAAP